METHVQDQQPEKSYAGSRYYREFISRMRKDEDAGKYEHLEDYPHDVLVDERLGVRLYHAGINPYDQEHFRHQLYLVVMAGGKASKMCPADSVVASALTLQWTRRGDLCNALLLSVKSFGQCTFAYCGDRSRNKCGWCGHSMRTLLWRNKAWSWVAYRPGRKLAQGERHCCSLNQTMKKYQCCKCRDPDNALMSPLDREAAAELPQSVLPTSPEAYRALNAHGALVPVPASASKAAPAPDHGGSTGAPVVNNFHLNFYGSNHIYPGASAGVLGAGGPAWSFTSMSQLDMDRRTRGLIDFSAAMTSAASAASSPPGGRVHEIDDASGPDATASGKPSSYASPKVEDDDDDADTADTGGVAHRLSNLALSST